MHLLQDHAQGQERCLGLDDRTAHDRGAEVDGAAVPDVGSLHLERHVLEGVKLQEAVREAVLSEAHRIPVGALHRLIDDGPVSDPTSQPT